MPIINLIKTAVRTISPKLFPAIHIIHSFLYDAIRFIENNHSYNYQQNKKKLASVIRRTTHGIEKAFSLPKTRVGFGVDSVLLLIHDTKMYYENYGYNLLIRSSADVLLTYSEYHKFCDTIVCKNLISEINKLVSTISEYDSRQPKIGGSLEVCKEDIMNSVSFIDFKRFTESRYSIRNFEKGPIPIDIIMESIRIALKSPSACNRQAWKAYYFKGKTKDVLLSLQNGNRGFTESIDSVILITGITSSFSAQERHQVYIDGGIFAMSVILALHSFGVGTCPLNTAFSVKEEKIFRKAINLVEDEVPIMIIAIGLIKERFSVAISERKEIEEVLIF